MGEKAGGYPFPEDSPFYDVVQNIKWEPLLGFAVESDTLERAMSLAFTGIMAAVGVAEVREIVISARRNERGYHVIAWMWSEDVMREAEEVPVV